VLTLEISGVVEMDIDLLLRIRSLKRKMNLRRNVQLAVSADADST
jgi:hypothetical protein